MSIQDGDEYNKLLQYINYRLFHCPARLEAEAHSANGQNAYVCYFTEETNDPDILSCHGYDLSFVLGNIDEASAKDIPAAYRLSEIMQQMWVNFAKTGDPSLNDGDVDGVGAIRWDKYETEFLPVACWDEWLSADGTVFHHRGNRSVLAVNLIPYRFLKIVLQWEYRKQEVVTVDGTIVDEIDPTLPQTGIMSGHVNSGNLHLVLASI